MSSSVTVLSYVFCAILSLLVLLVWRDARLVVSSSSGEMAAVCRRWVAHGAVPAPCTHTAAPLACKHAVCESVVWSGD